KVVDGLAVLNDKMNENLSGLGDGILAEPTYILLALSGHGDAHEIVRKATLESDSSGRPLKQVLKEDHPDIWKALSDRLESILGISAESFYGNPASYRGLASKRARDLAERYSRISGTIRKEVKE
ncbi:MAG: adenylosuccinate lyase, partial [Spirochaetaceae bacterium]|nr:adenylosuccinate lyase [Spirochaetaceae bacterium]